MAMGVTFIAVRRSLVCITLCAICIGMSTQDAHNPCFMWPESAYINGKCVMVVTNSNTQTPSQSCAQFMQPNGSMANFGTRVDEKRLIWDTLRRSGIEAALVEKDFDNCTTQCCMSTVDNNISCFPCDGHVDHHDYVVCQHDVESPCDLFLPGASYVTGRCLMLVKERLTWLQAQESCRSKSSFLTELTTPSEILQSLPNKIIGSIGVWTGGYEIPDNDGTNAPKYVWTQSGQSINGIPTGRVQCTDCNKALYATENYDRNIANADRLLPSLCQRDIGDPCEYTGTGGVYSSGYCWKHFDNPKNWSDANAMCRNNGGILMELQEPLTELPNALKQWMHLDTQVDDELWLGGHRLSPDKPYLFEWTSNGLPVTNAMWGPGYPSGDPDQDCLVYITDRETSATFSVMTGNCEEQREFICQIDVRAPTRRYAVPTLSSPNYKAYLHVTTDVTSARTYVTSTTFIGSQAVDTKFKSLTSNDVLRFNISLAEKPSDAGIIELITSYPVTVVMHLRQNNKAKATALIKPSLLDPFPWLRYLFESSDYFSSTRDRFKMGNELILFPMQPGRTTIKALLPHNADDLQINEVPVGNVNSLQVVLAQYEAIRFQGVSSVDSILIWSDNEIALFQIHTPYQHWYPEGLYCEQLLPAFSPSTSYVSIPVNAFDNGQWYAFGLNDTRFLMDFVPNRHNTRFLIEVSKKEQASPHPSWAFPAVKIDLNFPARVTQTLSMQSIANHSKVFKCSTTLVPQESWRHHFTLALPTGETSAVDYILIVERSKVKQILINGHDTSDIFDCTNIADTPFASCYNQKVNVEVSTTEVTHFKLQDNSRFMAYILYTDNGLFCNPMGMADNVARTKMPVWPIPDPIPDEELTATTQVATTETTEVTSTQEFTTSTEESQFSTESENSGIPETTTSISDLTEPDVAQYVCRNLTKMVEISQEEKQKLTDAIKAKLRVNVTMTSAHNRKLTSANDKRPSSVAIGMFGVALISFTALAIIVPDITSLIHYCIGSYRRLGVHKIE